MSDVTKEPGVRGEFNRTFDLESVRGVIEGMFVFVSPEVQQYTLLAKPGKKAVIDGEVIIVPDVIVSFQDFAYRTKDSEVADLIRKSDAFQSGRIKELGTLRQETKASRLAAKAKEVAEDPDLTRAVLAQLKQGKTAAPEVVKS